VERTTQLPPPLHTCSHCNREISCVPCGCRFCEGCKDAPASASVGTMCRLASANGKKCGPYPELGATGAVQEGPSDTALEASMMQGEASKADVSVRIFFAKTYPLPKRTSGGKPVQVHGSVALTNPAQGEFASKKCSNMF
jgi:hypothetical protein